MEPSTKLVSRGSTVQGFNPRKMLQLYVAVGEFSTYETHVINMFRIMVGQLDITSLLVPFRFDVLPHKCVRKFVPLRPLTTPLNLTPPNSIKG